MYKFIIKKFLFLFDPEWVHHSVFNLIKYTNLLPGVNKFLKYFFVLKDKRLERKVFGLNFTNPVGLAAGFDKDAKLYNELTNFGFGFIEIGTLTPLPQDGNPKKRMFRLINDEAIINRMGFNNEGVEAAISRLKKNKGILIGGNIGKNKITPNEKAHEDYIFCYNALYDYVDYFVINVSSPNTPKLRALQGKKPLTNLLSKIKLINEKKNKPKPILLKISPDLNKDQLLDIIEIIKKLKIDGVIAANTTLSREGLISKNKNEDGGLSGRPLRMRSTEVIRFIAKKSNNAFPIIGVGGIHKPEDAIEKIKAGASLIQLYTGFIYEGPWLIKKINRAILNHELK